MPKTTRAEIRIETHEIKIVRFQGKASPLRCERCQGPVPEATPEQAAELLRLAGQNVIGGSDDAGEMERCQKEE